MAWGIALALAGCLPDLGDALRDDDATDDDVADDDVADDDAWDEPPALIDDVACVFENVFSHDGLLLDVQEGASSWSVAPLDPGAGFVCAVLRFRMTTPDNLSQLADDHEGCPTYLSIALVEGTGADGEELAHGEFQPFDDDGGCERGADRVEVHNFMATSAGLEGPWPPGESWEIELRIQPFLSRLALARDGEPIGPHAEAPLTDGEVYASYYATVDPRFELGLPAIHHERHFPWYGATYSDVQVWIAATTDD